MKKLSDRNTFKASDGTRHSSAQVDRKVRKACRERMQLQVAIHGYNFCEECLINDRHAIIDPSHDTSVDQCKKNGYVERAWDTTEITPRCRTCHRIYDKNNIR